MSDLNAKTISLIRDFVSKRDWDKFHNPKDLAISVSIEAAELLEVFQWSGSETMPAGKREKIREELADVLIYAVLLNEKMGFDLNEIIEAKIRANEEKYPVDKAYGSARKYTDL